MTKLKVGIAGYGIVGRRRRLVIDAHPNLQLVAVCDQTFSSKGVMNDGVRYYSNYHDLLLEELDVLFVCMTNDMNAEVTISALNYGAHVFCEKPPGRCLEEVSNVLVTHKSRPKQCLMYGFNHRYHESVMDALKLAESGDLGDIINMRGVYGKSQIYTFNQSDWRSNRVLAGGGVLLDQGIHMVDLMRLFAGEFSVVSSVISNSHWGYEVEDNAYALMKTKKGVVAMLNSSATQWRHRFNLDINFERGSLILGGLLTGTKSYGAETLTVSYTDHLNPNGDPKEYTTRYNKDDSWELEVKEFVNCILGEQQVKLGSVLDAFKTMELVSKIYYADPEWRKKFNLSNPEDLLKNYE